MSGKPVVRDEVSVGAKSGRRDIVVGCLIGEQHDLPQTRQSLYQIVAVGCVQIQRLIEGIGTCVNRLRFCSGDAGGNQRCDRKTVRQ